MNFWGKNEPTTKDEKHYTQGKTLRIIFSHHTEVITLLRAITIDLDNK